MALEHHITAAWLRKRRGSCDQLAVFEREWPDGVEVNEKNLLRAAALGLNLQWFALKWLDHNRYYAEFEPLDDPYWSKTKALYDAHQRRLARLLASMAAEKEAPNV